MERTVGYSSARSAMVRARTSPVLWGGDEDDLRVDLHAHPAQAHDLRHDVRRGWVPQQEAAG